AAGVRAGPADAPVQSDSRRPVRTATAAAERARAAGARVRQPRLPAPVPRHPDPEHDVSAPARDRPRALTRRSVARAGRPYAGAVGGGLRPWKPNRAVAQPARRG